MFCSSRVLSAITNGPSSGSLYVSGDFPTIIIAAFFAMLIIIGVCGDKMTLIIKYNNDVSRGTSARGGN